MHPVTAEVTERIEARSRDTRADYLARMEAARHAGTGRGKLSCANWAHVAVTLSDERQVDVDSPTPMPANCASGCSSDPRPRRDTCR